MATERLRHGRRALLASLGVLAVLILVVIGVIVSGRIGSKPPAATTASPSVSATGSAKPSASIPASLAPGDHTLTVTVGGRDRTLILHLPPAASNNGSRALVLVFHGALDTAADTESSTDFDQVADKRGMLVAFLQGYQNTWNEGAGHTPAEVAGIDDVAFASAALTEIENQVPVNRDRIAAVGFSNGALLADLLGCKLAASIQLIVPVAGPLPVSVASNCAPGRPVSVLEIHGTSDASIPYDGGPFSGVGGGTTVLSAPDAVARWASLDGCVTTPTTVSEGKDVRVTSYRGCDGDASVSLRTLVGAGHAWPSEIGVSVADALVQ